MPNKFLISLAVLTAAAVLRAEPEAKPPSENPERTAEQPRRQFGDGMGRFRQYMGARGQLEPTDDEWAEVAVFMKEHSPQRWRMYQNAPEGHQGRLRGPIYSAWKTLTRLEREDKEMYELRLKRLPIEDDIFALSGDIKKGGEKAPELRAQLRAKVAAFMDSRMEERKLRITRLQKSLKEEQQALTEFDSQRDRIVDNRTREVVTQGPGALRERSDRPDDAQRNAIPETEASPPSPRREARPNP
jgi:hypothetical protein